MDPFDDILPVAPAPRARAGGRFVPKPKSKLLPRKEVFASQHASSFKDGKDEHIASSTTSMDTEGISQNQCHNAVASSAEESLRSSLQPPVEIPSLEDITSSKLGNSSQVNVNGDTAALVDSLPSTIAVSEVDADLKFTNFQKSAHEADPVDIDVGPVTNFHLETNFNHVCSTISGMEESSQSGEASLPDGNKHFEFIDNSLQVGPDVGFTSDSDHKVSMMESNIHSNFNFGRGREVESAEFDLDPFSNILPDPGARNAHKFLPKIKRQPRVGNAPAIASASSNVVMENSVELPTCTNKVQSFETSGDGSGGLIQSTNLSLPTSEILKTTDLSNKPDNTCSSIPFSEDKRSLGAVMPSQLDSLNAMLSEVAVNNGARDWPSNYGKSAGETADIFSGLDCLDDFLNHAATDTGKPALHSFNEKDTEENFVIPACSSANSFTVCDAAQAQRFPKYNATQDSLTFKEDAVLNGDDIHTTSRSETEEVVDLNPACPVDDVFGYPSMKSGADPTSEIPVHEELRNAADSSNLADFLHAEDVTADADEREKDGTMSSSLRKHKRSSIAGEENKGSKPLRQLRKQAAKPVNDAMNEDVEDDDNLDPPYNSDRDKLEENDDEFQVDYSSKKKRASTSSRKKSVDKNGKPSQMRKRNTEDLEKSTKEPPKKFSYSTRRKKRCVDKALLEIPEDELDPLTLPIKDIILLAEYRERQAKKEATTAKASSINQSGGDSFHEAAANNEEDILGSEDRRDPGDDQTSEKIPLAPSLFNYQSFMDKEPRGKWSKQDTELFYEAVRQFGTDFSMIQQLFPGRTRHQVKLKYKKEERQHPLQLSDAVNNRSKDHSHFKLVIERLQQASPKAKQDPSRDASDFMTGEEVEDLTPGTNEEVATTEQDSNVKAQEDSVAFHSSEQSDDSDDDFQRWSQYKSDY